MAGRYLYGMSLWIDDVTDSVTDISISLEASNRTIYFSVDPHEGGRASSNSWGTNETAIVDCDASDTLKFKASASGTSKTVDLGDSTTVWIELLG